MWKGGIHLLAGARWQAWDLEKRLFLLFRKGDPDVIAVGAAALRWQFITFPLGHGL